MPWTKLRAKPSFLSYLDLGVGVLTEADESFHALGKALRGLDDRGTHTHLPRYDHGCSLSLREGHSAEIAKEIACITT